MIRKVVISLTHVLQHKSAEGIENQRSYMINP